MRTAILVLLLTPLVHANDLPRGAILRLGNAGFRHQSLIQRVLWTPDGKSLISAGLDERVSVWDVASGRRIIATHFPPQDQDIPLAVSHDGRYMAVSSWTNWNAR